MKTDTIKTYEERITLVLNYIQDHLYEDINLDTLASISYFSPYHFHRIFKGMVGETVGEYTRRLKLERAAIDLSQTSKRVTDIAFEANYETVESFSRAFAGQFKLTPNLFRKERMKFNEHKAQLFHNKILKGEKNMLDVKIIKKETQKVAYVRHIGPYTSCEKAWKTLCEWACPKGLFGPNTQTIGLCYDDPEVTPADKIRYDACITIEQDIDTEGEIKVQEIPEGEYATVIHTGPCSELKDTYSELCGQWLPASGREMKHAPSIEIYLSDFHKTPPEKQQTQIMLPLK